MKPSPAFLRAALLLTSVGLLRLASATGFYGPSSYLGEGGRRVAESPEFLWELEVKRLARDFRVQEKLTPVKDGEAEESGARRAVRSAATAAADLKDFETALSAGRIKPPDATAAASQHQAARDAISAGDVEALPAEFPSEFADYHRGAFAFRRGAEHSPENAARRGKHCSRDRNRSGITGASGRLSCWARSRSTRADYQAAIRWFRETRDLARGEFSDSLGLAADSYGWEGRAEWKQGQSQKAAPLFLTQLALGDEGAVISLKALVPDRTPVDGMLNYGPELDEHAAWDEATARAREQEELERLKMAARDPLLRRLRHGAYSRGGHGAVLRRRIGTRGLETFRPLARGRARRETREGGRCGVSRLGRLQRRPLRRRRQLVAAQPQRHAGGALAEIKTPTPRRQTGRSAPQHGKRLGDRAQFADLHRLDAGGRQWGT